MSMHGSTPTEEDEYRNPHLTNSFLDLPDEIIEKILFDLDFTDRCKMRGMNKRLYGIEERMKKPLEKRKKIEIAGHGRASLLLSISVDDLTASVTLDEAILLIHRFAKIFKFRTVIFAPSQKKHIQLLDGLSEVATDLIRIPAWSGDELEPNNLCSAFGRSTICNLMQNADVVKILRVCAPVKAEDLKHIYEIAQVIASFCGISLRIPRKTARDFVKNFLGEEDKMSGTSWFVEKTEGRLEMVVERFGSTYKFGLYNSECEEKFPMLSFDLYENSECDSEEEYSFCDIWEDSWEDLAEEDYHGLIKDYEDEQGDENDYDYEYDSDYDRY